MAQADPKQKKEHKQRLDTLREKTHKKIDYHSQKTHIEHDDFYKLVAEFFMELLEKEYHATYEELAEELHTIEHDMLYFTDEQKQEARRLLHRLSEIQFSPEGGQIDHRQLLEEFRDLAVLLTQVHPESIDRLLHQGMIAADKKDKKNAEELYRKARLAFDALDEQQQEVYLDDLKKLFDKVHS